MNKIIIFDGKNLLWRAHSVFNSLNVDMPDGENLPTGGIYGFLSLATLKWRKYGGRALVAWEGKGNFRRKEYPEYKRRDSGEIDERRQIMLEEIRMQEARLKAILRAMGVEQWKSVGGEADDVMGTLAKKHVDEAKDNRAVIYTGDSDLRQLVSERITIVSPGFKGKDNEYARVEDVVAKDLVSPGVVADMKALSGDKSDNIPGVSGIGAKTAQKLLDFYGSSEKVVKAAVGGDSGWPIPERFKASIAENAENIKLYKKLATVRCDIGMKLLKPKKDKKALLGYLRLYHFSSLMSPLELSSLVKMGGAT